MLTLREKAVSLVKTLRKAGYEAYWAGGSVRDLIMGTEPDDYDIATNAQPEEVMKLFKNTIPVGVAFGVVRVRLDDDEFEVAAFRSDGRYIDGRHPETVTFSDAREDAKRRDFTINGMFYDPEEGIVIDYVEGQADIKKGVIRAIGDAGKRFEEDRLRMIRAVRFSARFGFPIEPETEKALRRFVEKIPSISGERIRDELEKMLCGPKPADSMRLLHQTGIMKVILPEVVAMDGVEQPPQFHPEGDVLTHTFLLMENFRKPSFELALAALLHDIGKPPTFTVSDRIRFNNHCEVGELMSREICRRLRLSSDQTRLVGELVRDHLRFKDVKQMRMSTLKRFLRRKTFSEHLELHRIDCLACHGDLSLWEFCKDRLAGMGPEEVRPVRVLTGHDLIERGYSPGPLFSEILRAVEDAQLEGTILTRDQALKWVDKTYLAKGGGPKTR